MWKNFFWGNCLVLLMACQSETTPFHEPPEWSKHAVWYQIFVERFRNGDPTNDPTLASIQGSYPHEFPADWCITPWNSDWYANTENFEDIASYYTSIQSRRYGGDLQGVLDKIPYLKELGITAVYFNPLNDAPSAHKYDARNYHHIDINFGPDPDGDRKIIASENPNDPKTWKFTSADKLFLQVVREFRKHNIRVIMDFSWNHTGIEFFAWKDILKNQSQSKFKNWYEIEAFANPKHPDSELKYTGWAGVKELPELKKVRVKNRVHGKPYSGNIHPEVKEHIFAVTKRWLDPHGDGSLRDGVDGFRLDVADQIGLDFWRDYRKWVRSINPNAYLLGEIWWEEWPDKMMDPKPYLQGDMFDAVMWYQIYQPARDFFSGYQKKPDAKLLIQRLQQELKLPQSTLFAMMSMSASHDTPRLLSCFYNKGKYKYKVKPTDNPKTLTGKPSQETFRRVKNFLVFQYGFVGSPQIWAGDEMGMWGTDDPDCRKPLWWPDITFEPETQNPFHPNSTKEKVAVGFQKEWFEWYKKLISIRKQHACLRVGSLTFLPQSEGGCIGYERSLHDETIVVLINHQGRKHKLSQALVGRYVDLLTGKSFENITQLFPWQALMLKKKS